MAIEAITNEELALRIRGGERELIPVLWEQCRRFIYKHARQHLPRCGDTRIEISDLLDAGFEGLVTAVEGFDPTAGCSFLGYLQLHLKSAFIEACGRNCRHPDPLLGSCSLDIPRGDEDNSCTLQKVIPDPGAAEPFDRLIDDMALEADYKAAVTAMGSLVPEQREIIKAHYLTGQTLEQIAQARGKSKERIRQIERDGLKNLLRQRRVQRLAENWAARAIDRKTNFYREKGACAFQSTGTSAVEDIVEAHERMEKAYDQRLDEILSNDNLSGKDLEDEINRLDAWYDNEFGKADGGDHFGN